MFVKRWDEFDEYSTAIRVHFEKFGGLSARFFLMAITTILLKE
jgi:hypothetical protein